MGAIHPKAMPVMLDRRSFNRWLDVVSAIDPKQPPAENEQSAEGKIELMQGFEKSGV